MDEINELVKDLHSCDDPEIVKKTVAKTKSLFFRLISTNQWSVNYNSVIDLLIEVVNKYGFTVFDTDLKDLQNMVRKEMKD